jgi:hypothetical protein
MGNTTPDSQFKIILLFITTLIIKVLKNPTKKSSKVMNPKKMVQALATACVHVTKPDWIALRNTSRLHSEPTRRIVLIS